MNSRKQSVVLYVLAAFLAACAAFAAAGFAAESARAEWIELGHPEPQRHLDIIAIQRMHIEREMSGKERQPSFDCPPDPSVMRPCDSQRLPPEETVMNNKHVSTVLYCAVYGIKGSIDCESRLPELSVGRSYLHSVE